MLVALDVSGSRKVAVVDLRGLEMACPDCREPVVVRAGTRVIPHFAHRSGTACSEAKEAMRKRRDAARKARRQPQTDGQQVLFDLESSQAA